MGAVSYQRGTHVLESWVQEVVACWVLEVSLERGEIQRNATWVGALGLGVVCQELGLMI